MKQFIERNKNLTWNFPKTNLTNPVEFTEWLVKQKDIGWFKLDIDIDIDKWKTELTSVEQFYVNHRYHQGHQGWQGCSIHGLSSNSTESTNFGNFDWTEISNLTPSITNFWKNYFPVQGYKRLRFMKLSPGGFVDIHNDLPDGGKFEDLDPLRQTLSINLAVVHPDNCNMIIEGCGTVPWQEGSAFIINITKNHCLVNNSNKDRIHMIAECVVGDRLSDFAELIYRSYQRYYCD